MEKNAHILPSENSKKNNKLYMKWMKDCFELAIKNHC